MSDTNALAINSLMFGGMDPYMYYALQSPNINNPSFRGAAVQPPAAANTSAQPVTTVSGTQLPVSDEGKKNSKALPVLGIIATGAAAFFTHKAYKIGPETETSMLKRVGGGFKEMFSGVKEKVIPKYATVSKNNGKTVVTLPGKKNVIPGDKASTELEKIGENLPEPENLKAIVVLNGDKYALKQGYDLLGFNFKTELKGSSNYKVSFNKNNPGEVQITELTSGSDVTNRLRSEDKNVYDAIMKRINNIKAGKDNYSELDELLVENTNGNIVSKIKYSKNNDSIESQLMEITTDMFDLEHTLVKAARTSKQFDAKLTAFEKGETENMTVAKAFVEATLKDKNKSDLPGRFVVDGKGHIISFKPDGKKEICAGTDVFRALNYDNQDAFKTATDRTKWTNIVYKAA